MPTNSNSNVPISRTPPPLAGTAKVSLVKSDFDAGVWKSGNDVFVDKAIRCPCRVKSNNQALSSCRNCGGSGYVFLNRYRTRLIMQSMNIGTKFKEWSETKLGTVSITARSEDELAFMDRVTQLDGLNIHNETIHAFIIDNSVKGRLDYPPIEIEEISVFVDSDTKLRKLVYGTDYSVLEDIITFSKEFYVWKNFTISLRYKYYPTFHVIDLPRGTMQSDNIKGAPSRFPIHAIGRRAHYVIDGQNIKKDFLINNSYDVLCQKKANVVIESNIVC